MRWQAKASLSKYTRLQDQFEQHDESSTKKEKANKDSRNDETTLAT